MPNGSIFEVSVVFLDYLNDQINQGMLGQVALVLEQNFSDDIGFPWLTGFLSRQPWGFQLWAFSSF